MAVMTVAVWAADSPKYEPTTAYAEQTIEGWRVLVNKRFSADKPDLTAETLKELGSQLYRITRQVPAAAVEKLRKIPIWVEREEGHHPCMAYHPSADWLREHDMNPEKARSVEIANAANFLTWTHEQPWMVLHELAHGYHDRFLPGGYENADLRAVFKHAGEKKLYEAVLRSGGRTERAYATTNPMEYFAETSEAFFGTNDFYPFVRTELQKHDPEMYELLRRLWGVEGSGSR